MEICLLLFLSFGALTYAQYPPCQYPAKTETGTVCGVKKKASNGDEFVSFMGIPYAKAPLGVLRFAEPQKRDPFDGGVFDATRPGPVCPQAVSEFGTKVNPEDMTEDCLRVNVHVPLSAYPEANNSSKPKVPIYAFVHGGSFATGSGNTDIYGPEYLVTKGVMLVTFNYRLNSIGFLSLASKYVPGNTGLRDIVFVLKWINRNIANFGGDPDAVTLSGQSAGGAAAHLVAISPAVRNQGLIKRVLALSGNAYANFYGVTPIASKIYSELFLRAMNISSFQPSKAIFQKLASASIEEILFANEYVTNKTLSLNFCPVIENTYEGFTTILPKHPEDLVKAGHGNEFTTLLGFTSNECIVYKRALEAINFQRTMRLMPAVTVPFNLLFSSNIFSIPVMTKKISREYFNSTPPTLEKFFPLCNDGFYKYPVMRLAEQRLAGNSEPTYAYEFAYEGKNTVLKKLLQMDWKGAGHSEDISFFFRGNAVQGPLVVDELAQPDVDSQMRNWMTTFVANFVKTGRPTTDPETWPQTGEQFYYQEIDTPDKYNSLPATPYMKDKKRFFDLLYRIGRLDVLG